MSSKKFPSRTSINAEINYKDSGHIIFLLKSPLIEEYQLIDSPYTLFRKGIDVSFYADGTYEPGYLKANWAKFETLKKLYYAYGNVEIINKEKDTLKTDTLFWDQINRRIYTQDTVKIIRKDGSYLIAAYGMDASEDFNEYTLYNNKGAFIMKSEEL